MKKQKGFTLIELLVSISIIAILTALLTVNFIGARQRGRDGQRKSNLYNIQSALELYRADNGNYPFPLMAAAPGCGSGISLTGGTGAVYMKTIPCDPSSGNKYLYISTDGTSYTLYACLENQADSDRDTDATDITESTCSNSYVPFKLTNP